MTTIQFTVLGEPVAKERHRTARLKIGVMIQYKSAKAKKDEQSFIAQAIQHAPKEPFAGHVTLVVDAYMQIPSGWSKKKIEQALNGELRPTKKPDLDNLLKFVGDTLNCIFWGDDRQIVAVSMRKFWSNKPRLEICVTGE